MKDVSNSKLLNVLIPCGVALFIACAVFAFLNSPPKMIDNLIIAFQILQFVLGVVIIIISIKKTHRATQLFIGLLLIVWAIFYFLLQYCLPCTLKEFWPVYGIATGALLFVSGFYKYQKFKFGYVVPAFTLFGMGVWYSFFSFNIIKKSFLTVVSNLGPAFMLVLAILLVVLFLLQQKHKEFVLPDDELGTFSDEDDEIMIKTEE